MPDKCTHPVVYWYKQGDGEAIYARRPPSRGKLRYYLAYDEAVADQSEPTQFVSKGLEHYTQQFTN